MISLRRTLQLLLGVLAATLSGSQLLANSARTPDRDEMRQLYHSTWTVRDGAPVGIWRIAQSTDGFLWIATNSGLYRFDGVQFTKFRPADGGALLSENIITLFAPSTGGLWLGYQFGGISFIRDGRIANYPAEGIFASSSTGFLELKDGTLWTSTGQGMARFVHNQWQQMGPEWGFHGRSVFRPFLDATGALWAYNGKTLQYLPGGEHRFRDTNIEGKFWGLLADRPDRIWLAGEYDLVELIRAYDGSWSLYPAHIDFSPGFAAQARDGSFWMASDQSGVFRLPSPLPLPGVPVSRGELENFTAKDGLTANVSMQVIRDREGSMWVATEKGLDQFRPAALSSVAMPAGTNGISLAQDKVGLLVGVKNIRGPSLFRLRGNELVPIPHSPEGITSIYAEGGADVWLGATSQLWHMVGDRFTKIPMPEDVSGLPLEIQTMTTDAKGVLWASILGHGTFKFDGGRWTRFKALDADHFAVLSIMRDHEGRIWQGFVHNNVAIVAGDATKKLGLHDGVTAGNILAIAERGDHVWLGGTEGLSYYRNGAVRSILSCSDESIKGVNGIVESADGDLWLNQASGVIFISRDEIAQVFADPRHRVNVRLYNYLDGLIGAPVQLRPLPTAIATKEGHIYFAARHELTWIDPAHIASNLIPPKAVIDQLVADGHQYLSPAGITLNKGMQNLRFDYTASSLLIPQRVHFRYMLEGFDKSWQDAGTRRQAFYSKIPPGHYTFRVMASNNDGVWSPTATTTPLYLPPTFRQSKYFAALLAAITATFLTLLHKLRLRYATNQIRSRLLERLSERERIAQDLHDTFFQSIQVLLLRFYTVTKGLPQDEPSRRSYEDTLKQSEQVMREGRELLLELRSVPSRDMPISTTFKQMVEDLRPNTTAQLTFEMEGRHRELAADPGSEAIKIVREALANAIRHAGASCIEVLLTFGRSHLRVTVRDDGNGIPNDVLQQGHRQGHLGMVSMRERAIQLGARIEIRRILGGGTAVELLIPAAVIYLTEN